MILELMLIGLWIKSSKISKLEAQVAAQNPPAVVVPKLGFWAQVAKDRVDVAAAKAEAARPKSMRELFDAGKSLTPGIKL